LTAKAKKKDIDAIYTSYLNNRCHHVWRHRYNYCL